MYYFCSFAAFIAAFGFFWLAPQTTQPWIIICFGLLAVVCALYFFVLAWVLKKKKW